MPAIAWSRSAFVLVAPDAVARHLALPLLRRVAEHGFRPVAYRLLQADAEQLDAMHRAHAGLTWSSYRYRLIDQLFAFGPCLAVAVEDVSGRGGSHARLRRLKGDSDPAQALPGTLRHDLGAINNVLSLVHFSDEPEASELESGAFFGRPPGEVDPCAGDVWALAALVSAGRPETRGFDDVLSWVRSRLLAAAWADLTPDGRRLAAAAAEDEWLLVRPGFGTEVASRLRGGASHPLAALLRAEFVPPHPDPPSPGGRETGVDVVRAMGLLAAHGIHLDRWAALVLATSAHFAPRRAAAAAEPFAPWR